MRLTRDDVAWRRIVRSGLADPMPSPVEVCRSLIGAQSQFLPSTGFAIRNRLAGDFTQTDLDAALHEEKSLLRLWGQRNTVHVYDIDDWGMVVAAGRAITTYRQRIVDRLGRTEAELDEALGRVADILRSTDRASRAEFITDSELEPWFHVNNVLMMDLVRRGEACHAGVTGGRSYFAHREVWRPDLEWDPPATDEAGRALALRYFATYGPATTRDFVFWLGVRAADGRRWVEEVRDDLIEVDVDGESMWDAASAADAKGSEAGTPPRSAWPRLLLHRFDPLLLAHKDKSWIVDGDHYKAVWRKAGYVEAVIVRGGRIRGTWGYEKKSRGTTVWLQPFSALPKRERTTWEGLAERAAGYLQAPLLGIESR